MTYLRACQFIKTLFCFEIFILKFIFYELIWTLFIIVTDKKKVKTVYNLYTHIAN